MIDNACPDQPPVDYSAPVSMNLDETWPLNADSNGSFSWKAWISSANLRTCRILLNGLHQDLQEVELHLGGVSHVHGWPFCPHGLKKSH